MEWRADCILRHQQSGGEMLEESRVRIATGVMGTMSNAHVLVVDSDPERAKQAVKLLIELGYPEPKTALSAEAAVQIAQQGGSNLALVSLHCGFGNSNAIQIAQRIRQTSGLPVFFQSAYSDDNEAGNPDPVLLPFIRRDSSYFVELALRKRTANFYKKPSRPLILVADDDALYQWTLVRQIESLGYTVDCAANGREAAEMQRRIGYDLIFMDYQMPDMDGHEAISQIRNWEGNALFSTKVPIFVVTAHPLERVNRKFVDVLTQGCFEKPVAREKLAEILSKWTQGSRVGAEVRRSCVG